MTTVGVPEGDLTHGPFGAPEGAWGDLAQLIQFPTAFHGLARSPSDSEVRIVAGPLGSGKSFLMRRLQNFQESQNQRAVYSAPVQRTSDLRSEDVVAFTERSGSPETNSEIWKALWRRSILRSVASHMRYKKLSDYLPVDAPSFWSKYSDLLGSPDRERRDVAHEAKEVIGAHMTGRTIRKYLDDDGWADVENWISDALSSMPPVFLYIDELDKEYKSAPSAWTLCSRALVYTIMDLQRDERFQGRLHVVVAVRDTTIAAISASEQAQRLLDPTYCNMMAWDRKAAGHFLAEKTLRLRPEYHSNSEINDVASFIGLDHIETDRPSRNVEEVMPYILRHTSLVARDIILLGNKLCLEKEQEEYRAFTPDRFKRIISHQAKGFAEKLLAVAANQALADVLPPAWWRLGRRLRSTDLMYASHQVLLCIESTGTEVFDQAAIDRLDSQASELFRSYTDKKSVHLADVLWQNRLLGVFHGDQEASFFDLNDVPLSHALPRAGAAHQYVWNPLIFDVTSRIHIDLDQPLWPA